MVCGNNCMNVSSTFEPLSGSKDVLGREEGGKTFVN